MKGAGLMDRLFSKATAYKISPTTQSVDSAGKPFSYYYIRSTFGLLCIGIIASMIAFLIEVFITRYERLYAVCATMAN